MLDLCASHIVCCGFNFNVKKSICCAFSTTVDACNNLNLLLYNSPMKVVNSFDYLGITFLSHNGIKVSLDSRIRKFYFAISSVLRFNQAGFERVLCYILIHKCLPILTYGCDCCMLNVKSRDSLCKAWNNAFRMVYKLPKFTSTRHLFLANNTMSLRFMLDKSRLCFLYNVRNCDKKLLNVLECYVRTSGQCRKQFIDYFITACMNVKTICCLVHDAFKRYCNA